MNDTVDRLRFGEHFRALTDDDLMRLAMDENLIPAAREAITDELEARGLQDLSSFKKRFAQEAAIARALGVTGGLPSSALYAQTAKDQSLMERLAGPFAAILLFCGICAGANYYMDLGWFGRFGGLVMYLTELAMLTFILALRHASREK
jgi:hypothetical protein